MKIIRRFLFKEISLAVAFVTLGFLGLFFFFDLVDELRWITQALAGYNLGLGLVYVLLQVPSHLYELLPITVLIGTIYVMARLALSSEFTILRTSGLGPGKALGILLSLGLVFAATTFVLGDYVAPATDLKVQLMQVRYHGRMSNGQIGTWLKEHQGQRSFNVNIGNMSTAGVLSRVGLYEFDEQGRLLAITEGKTAEIMDQMWRLHDVGRIELSNAAGEQQLLRKHLADFDWPTQITDQMAATMVLKPDRMKTLDLFQYIQHLRSNGQSAQQYEIEFWRKVFYPLSCLVMVVLALPFAYLHFRGGNIASYVFGGLMAGISFFFLNNVFGYIGNLQNWTPWFVAAAPALVYSLISLGSLGWLVLRR
jgi:lipopolysaccharide export system permease protein